MDTFEEKQAAELPVTELPKTSGKRTIEEKKERIKKMRDNLSPQKSVGDTEELVPFSWRNPLGKTTTKMSKVYKAITDEENNRLNNLPAQYSGKR